MKHTRVTAAVACAALVFVAAVLIGCHNSKATPEQSMIEESTVSAAATVGAAPTGASGAGARPAQATLPTQPTDSARTTALIAGRPQRIQSWVGLDLIPSNSKPRESNQNELIGMNFG